MPLIDRKALPERIVDVMRSRIIAGTLAPDTSIRQDALAAELGVSKIPVREALARLEQDGLIVSQANRGFFVAPLSAEEAYDVFGLRLRIEPDAVAWACDRAGSDDRVRARRALDALNAAIAGHTPEIGACNRAFHLSLIRPGDRQVTLQIVERLHVLAERYVFKHLEPSSRNARAEAEHEALFESWAAGDASAAAARTTAHIEATLADLTDQFQAAETA
ncbi:GntR family transcriptional regulator [Labrys monachus]|uniref:DNA-binding GntR family transcriptional regulator n=1 Tax=Labrys monachus TaxID=217067 RepID=A0ABU0FMI1_9HYPH|nr:GntR family transcriptional regulator [Labrys monachus]MDQ0395801.1 DNA-binding GntR family transcriptional regulator [Labrys monachus]